MKFVAIVILYVIPLFAVSQDFRSEYIKYKTYNQIRGDKLIRTDSVILQINERMGDHDAEILIYMQRGFYRSEINIPKGYKINYLPSPYNVDDNLISIQYTVQKENNKIIINAGYTLKQNIYQPQNYISLKMSFAEAIKRFSEMVVLEKE